MDADDITRALFDDIKPPPFGALRQALEVALTNFGHALTFASAVPGYGPDGVGDEDGPAMRARVLCELLSETLDRLRYDEEAAATKGVPFGSAVA